MRIINVVNTWEKPFPFNHGIASLAGEAALNSLKAATIALKKKQLNTLVTAPIHKKNIQTKDFNFPGHFDYLNKELQGDSLMFMITKGLELRLLRIIFHLRK